MGYTYSPMPPPGQNFISNEVPLKVQDGLIISIEHNNDETCFRLRDCIPAHIPRGFVFSLAVFTWASFCDILGRSRVGFISAIEEIVALPEDGEELVSNDADLRNLIACARWVMHSRARSKVLLNLKIRRKEVTLRDPETDLPIDLRILRGESSTLPGDLIWRTMRFWNI